MSSPRSDRATGKLTLGTLVALALAARGGPLAAQDTAAVVVDTAQNRVGTDSLRADSAAAADTGQNRTRPDSLRADTAAAAAAPGGASPAAAAPPPPAPPPPVDSTLARACRASAGAPPDLVAVVFRPTTSPEERQAVAAAVGGTLAEQSEHQRPGAWYILVPGSGKDASLADRLIRLSPVVELSELRCPA
jgi:hypothetical protein